MTEADIQRQAELSALHDELTKFALWYVCAECNYPLVVRWWQGDYEVKCGKDKTHEGFISWRDTPAQIERRQQ